MRSPSMGRRATVVAIGAALTLGLSGCDGLCTGVPFFDAFFCRFNEAPRVRLHASPNPVVTGQAVTLDSSASTDDGDIVVRKWSTMDSLADLADGGASVTRTVDVPNGGTIQPSVTLTDDEGASATGSVDLVVVPTGPNRLPVAHIAFSPDHPDAGSFTTFTGSWTDDGRIAQAEWDFDGVPGFEVVEPVQRGDLSNVQDVRLSAGARGVSFRVTDDRGGQATALVHVDVLAANVPPVAQLSIPSTPPGLRVGDTITYDARDSHDPDGTIVNWRFDIDGVFGNGFERDDDVDGRITGSFDTPGDKKVGVRVFDDRGARTDLYETITILPAGGRPAHAAAVARRVRPVRFTAGLTARAVDPGSVRVTRKGHVRRVRGVAAAGRFKGRLGKGRRRAPKLLRAVLRAPWTGTIDASLNTRTHKRRVKVLALARLRHGARSCLRITLTDAPGRRPGGTFRVLGGTGAARRLTASGRFGLLPGSKVQGRLRSRTFRAHALPAACRAMLGG